MHRARKGETMLQIATTTTTTKTVRPGGYGWRRQAMSLMIVDIMAWASEKNRAKRYKKDDEIFYRITRWSGECKQAMGLPADMDFQQCAEYIEFNKSSGRKWSRNVDHMGTILAEALKHTDATVYLGAMLYVCETASESVPGDRVKVWDLLTRAVAALYKRVDPDMKAEDQVKAQRLGER